MPRLCRGRPLKRWRYVGVFSDELMACAANIEVGFARQTFWAVYLRPQRTLHERTRTLRSRAAVDLAPGHAIVNDPGIELALALEEEVGWQARCKDPGGGEVWTRKQAGVQARGSLRIGAEQDIAIEARAVIDDTAGYHARHTEWRWSAGVGKAPDGRPLGWNLVEGVNDPPTASERAVWVEGSAQEAAPVSFSRDLARIECADGSVLRFREEARRSRRENLLLIRSDYTAPFGSFSGVLPGGIELERGLGVVEHHRALW